MTDYERGTVQLFTRNEVDALNTARQLLRTVESRALDAAHRNPESYTAPRPLDLGRMAEACSVAEEAVFNALNTAASYLDDPAAEAGHRKWIAGAYAEPEA